MIEDTALSFGLVNGRPVFMDPTRDSYFLLPQKEEAEFLDARKIRPRSGSSASKPAEQEFAIASDLGGIVEANPPRPASSLLELPTGHAARWWRDLLRIACLQRRVRTELTCRPIAGLLRAESLKRPSDRELGTNGEIFDLALRYLRARMRLPFRHTCLVDTLTLVRWIGPAPRLLIIFGVKLDPFAAHCWAQLDDMILNDRCDHVAPFRPVRVIECTPASR